MFAFFNCCRCIALWRILISRHYLQVNYMSYSKKRKPYVFMSWLVNFLKFMFFCGKVMDLKMGHLERFLMTVWLIRAFILIREWRLTARVLLAMALYGAIPQGTYLSYLKFELCTSFALNIYSTWYKQFFVINFLFHINGIVSRHLKPLIFNKKILVSLFVKFIDF